MFDGVIVIVDQGRRGVLLHLDDPAEFRHLPLEKSGVMKTVQP